MQRSGLILFLWLIGCVPDVEPARLEVARIKGAALQTGREAGGLRSRMEHLVEESREVGLTYLSAATAFEIAAERFRLARGSRDEQRRRLEEASTTLAEAAERWHVVQQLIVAAAVLDATNMQHSGARYAAAGSCEAAMSTGAFRAALLGAGVSLLGLHVDHIVPRALGGADHPDNYQLLPARLNQRLGADWGADKCAIAGREACARAVTISRRCGAFAGRMPAL